MTPFYADDWLTVYGGDCIEVMRTMPADSVDCVVTSPPYWGLRDYGTATWEGGDAECDHRLGRVMGNANKGHVRDVLDGDRTRCDCGAVRIDSQLGLERTPEEYVANMVAVFAEVRRVLKPSGTCWLNLGDSFYSSTATQGRNEDKAMGNLSRVGPDNIIGRMGSTTYRREAGGLKPKDLVGIPWRVAFALQADGWYLRSDIIWSKPNPMPESVTDRPTKAHEYLFLLTKSARYYFDADAVRESPSDNSHGALNGDPGHKARTTGNHSGPLGLVAGSAGRNIRSVWSIATRPYPGAHFAVFPPELPERCIKAGSSSFGVCPECGAPWERVVERGMSDYERLRGDRTTAEIRAAQDHRGRNGTSWERGGNHTLTERGTVPSLTARTSETTGWRPTCRCQANVPDTWTDEAEPSSTTATPARFTNAEPAVVLDPFAGSGTVGMVANRLSRRAILIDLNPEYLKQQMKRNAQTPLGLDVA